MSDAYAALLTHLAFLHGVKTQVVHNDIHAARRKCWMYDDGRPELRRN